MFRDAGNAKFADKYDGKHLKMRLLNVTAFFFAVASALFLYALNYNTRHIEAEVQAKERLAQRAREDIAVLKAERGALARPDRIDGFARQLGLGPPKPEQFEPGPALSQLSSRNDGASGR